MSETITMVSFFYGESFERSAWIPGDNRTVGGVVSLGYHGGQIQFAVCTEVELSSMEKDEHEVGP